MLLRRALPLCLQANSVQHVRVPDVLLVRHAMPVVDRAVPADRWRLGGHGRCAAQRLSAVIPNEPFAVTSDEPKARETAEAALAACGGGQIRDTRVGETGRPHLWHDDFAEVACSYLAGRRHQGWEPPDAVASRFDAAVTDAVRVSGGASVVVFTHGLALTLWLQSIGAVKDAPRFWSELTLPDVWRVTVITRHGRLVARGSPMRIS